MNKTQILCFQVLLVLLLATETLTRKSKNYAVIVNSSKFWFNYRQTTNSLLLYHYMRDHGIPNENILVMNPDNIACNCRNNDPGSITSIDGKYEPNLFRNVEIDFRKDDVNIPNILGALRMRYDPRTSMKKRLIFDEDSKVLIYINGHGGDNYWKIQDTHAIMHYDFAKAIEELNAKKGYKDMLLISDSCAAYTIFDLVDQPNLIMIGSSSEGEKSYSQGRDALLDMAKTDLFSFDTEEFLRKFGDRATVQDLFSSYNAERLMGTPAMKSTFAKKKPSNIPVKEYFESESSWNPELVNFSNKENPVVKKELDHFADILKGLEETKLGKEEISYVKKNPIREVLEQESFNFVRYTI